MACLGCEGHDPAGADVERLKTQIAELDKWIPELRRANGELATKQRQQEVELHLRTDRIVNLERDVSELKVKVLVLQDDLKSITTKADAALQKLTTAMQQALTLIKSQDETMRQLAEENEVLKAVDGLMRM
jgi:chromosome segregation ATPase